MKGDANWAFHPLTAERWGDVVALFEHHGNPGYCWCMIWRLPTVEYRRLDSPGRRAAFETQVRAGTPTGVLGYADGVPGGWCSIAPRETYARLERSRTIPHLDDQPTWSVVCFYLQRTFRHGGFSLALLRAAVDYALSHGARVVEGYPVDRWQDENGKWQPMVSYRFMGSVSLYEKAGFKSAMTTEQGRRIMRYVVEDQQTERRSVR